MAYTYEDYKAELNKGDHCNLGWCSIHQNYHPDEEQIDDDRIEEYS